jgi:hypothetical protein
MRSGLYAIAISILIATAVNFPPIKLWLEGYPHPFRSIAMMTCVRMVHFATLGGVVSEAHSTIPDCAMRLKMKIAGRVRQESFEELVPHRLG